MECKVCSGDTVPHASAAILQGKYTISYYHCPICGFVQTETPYWLAEAYASAIDASDTGLVRRSLQCSIVTRDIIRAGYDPAGRFLDWGAGYGLFVRLMRDQQFAFDYYDPYCQNLFAREFVADLNAEANYELLTALEVTEHFIFPRQEFQKLTGIAPAILFTTELVPGNPPPQPTDWWYYALHSGQHISFYSLQSLVVLAKQLGMSLYSDKVRVHLLTAKQFAPPRLSKIC
jgi:hypothetical protein